MPLGMPAVLSAPESRPPVGRLAENTILSAEIAARALAMNPLLTHGNPDLNAFTSGRSIGTCVQ